MQNYFTQILKLETFSILKIEKFVWLVVHKFMFCTKKFNFIHLEHKCPQRKSKNKITNFEIRNPDFFRFLYYAD